MIARIHESMRKEDKGFTLVELLVVIVIIGILIAIAIPAFLKFRQNGWESQVKSDLRNAATAAEAYSISHNGSYDKLDNDAPAADGTSLQDNGFNPTSEVTIKVDSATSNNFKLSATHASYGGQTWTYDSTTGKIEKKATTTP